MTNPLRLGTGGSPLALARARTVAGRLGAELVAIGAPDAAPTATLESLREALRTGEIDAAVHAYDALPQEPAEGIVVAAVPRRADARDAFCPAPGSSASGPDALDAGARVGVETPLRRAQLLGRHPELQVVVLEGELDAHLARLADRRDDDAEPLDALLASAADLERLERTGAATAFLDLSGWPPHPAQGALAIETLAGKVTRVAKVEHRSTRLTTDAERAVVARLGIPGALLGASALVDDGLLFLSARVYNADGTRELTSSHALYPEDARDPAAELAERVADELLAGGARELATAGGGSA